MKLLLKFNLVFIGVFLLGWAATGLITRQLLEKALAVRSYTSTQVAPLLETQMKYAFLPQSVPAFSATEVLGKLHRAFPEFNYKEATLNPTNPRDRAVDWEADVIAQFRNTPETLVDRYGPANGFGWQLHEVVGAQMVAVPMAVPMQRAAQAWMVFMALLTAVFVAVGLALNGMLWWLVVRPVTRLAAIADRVSLGDADAPAFAAHGKDEIGVLAHSFTRMRLSLGKAMKMLEASS